MNTEHTAKFCQYRGGGECALGCTYWQIQDCKKPFPANPVELSGRGGIKPFVYKRLDLVEKVSGDR